MARCTRNEACHHERHRTITKLVNDVKSFNGTYQRKPVRKRRKSAKQESGDDLPTYDESTTDVSSDYRTSLYEGLGAYTEAEEPFMSPSERRALKKAAIATKNQEKAFKHQQKIVVSVSQAHIDLVARVIHGSQYNVHNVGGHLATNENDFGGIFNRHDTYNASIDDHSSWLKGQVRDSRARAGKKGEHARKRQHDQDVRNGLPVQMQDVEERVSAILTQLGLPDHGDAHSKRTRTDSSTPNRSRKQQASLLVQLRKEILFDVEKSENERRARQQRMSGYWRYVNGTVSDRLANNAHSVDRATGVKLKGTDGRQSFSRMSKIDHTEDLEIEAHADHDERPGETDQSLEDS